MTIYDIHQHLWPETFIEALRARTGAPMLRDNILTTVEGSFELDRSAHDVDARIGILDRDGIDVAIVSLQPSLGIESLPERERDLLEETWIEGIAELVDSAQGRFRALAPWRVVDGFVGTSVGASTLFDPGRGASVMREVDTAGGLLFVHPEAEGPVPEGLPEWWTWGVGYTTQMQHAYLAWLGAGRRSHPSTRMVFAILAGGGPIHHERLVHRGVEVRNSLDPDTFFDTSTYGRRAIELCIETFGVERLVYGSDFPVVDTRPTLRAVRGLGDSVARLLQSDTPGRLIR